jgi:tungstate transport system permease protein
MNDFARSVGAALSLIGDTNPELLGIVALSLCVSLTASIVALLIGTPIGGWLAIARFPGRQTIIVLINALLGLPPVVVGLALYLLLSRSGPLGSAGLLFTPAAMVIAQTLLAVPIVVALVHRPSTLLWAEYGDLARIDGLSAVRSIALLFALGRASWKSANRGIRESQPCFKRPERATGQKIRPGRRRSKMLMTSERRPAVRTATRMSDHATGGRRSDFSSTTNGRVP